MTTPTLGTVLKSVTLSEARYPWLSVNGDRILLGSGVAGSSWTLYTFDLDLNLLSTETGGVNPAGGPQLFAPGRLQYREQDLTANPVLERQPDGSWAQVGTAMPGYWMARDGHSVSMLPGAVEYDGQRVDPFAGQNGAATIAGDWLIVSDHTNTQLARRRPTGVWETRTWAEGILSSLVCPGGVALVTLATGALLAWMADGSVIEASVSDWTREGCGDSCDVDEVVTCHYDAGTSRFFVFLRPVGEDACITLERFHQDSWARLRMVTDTVAVLATYAPPPYGVGVVLDLIDLMQPTRVPEPPSSGPPIDPPVDPPDGGDMTEAQYLALLVKVNEAVEAAGRAETVAAMAEVAALAARDAALVAVARVTDAPVKLRNRFVGAVEGTLNPKQS